MGQVVKNLKWASIDSTVCSLEFLLEAHEEDAFLFFSPLFFFSPLSFSFLPLLPLPFSLLPVCFSYSHFHHDLLLKCKGQMTMDQTL